METITWRHQCFVCKRPIQGGYPCVVFSTDKAGLVGVCHAKCSYSLYRYDCGWFRMHPPDYLSSEQVSFLMHFFPRLYSLPGGGRPNWQLRSCLGSFITEYPASMRYPMSSLHASIAEHKHVLLPKTYEGDLEAGFLRSLGAVQGAAREMPIHMTIDFRSWKDAAATT